MWDDRSHLTAIFRKKISAPAKRLQRAGLLKGRVLDYGCGRGADCKALDIPGYDPHWCPEDPGSGWDTILCTYVLNILPSRRERESVVKDVVSRLAEGGKAYFTVRRDIRETGWTSTGTWQGIVYVPSGESLWKNSDYETYEVSR